jgi:TatD DNase family protein
MGYLIDTHCHLDVKHNPGQLAGLIARAKEAGVGKMIWVGIDAGGTERAFNTSFGFDSIYVSAGVHPHDADKYTSDAGKRFVEMATSPKVVGIGETGLDFYRDYSPRDAQYEAFNAQCEIACSTGLPIVIHSRNAPGETWGVIEKYLPKGLRGVFHCYAYDLDYARRVLDAGFYIALNGILTYPKSEEMRSMAKQLPLDRLVIETDAPYLLPQKYRHRDNEPAYIVETFNKLVEIRGVAPDELMQQLLLNTENCFPKIKGTGD